MKDITVLDILHLPIMANADIKAGRSGLANIVSYVNVLDNFYDERAAASTPINYGRNFYLTSMFHGIENEGYIVTLMKHFVELDISALCIINEYMNELPQEAYDIADQHQIPIIFIDSSTPYALIISSIMELKMSYHEFELHENMVYELTSSECSEKRKSEIMQTLNPRLQRNVVAFHCVNADLLYNKITTISNEIYLLSKSREDRLSFACPHKNGVLIVYSFPQRDENMISEIMEEKIRFIRTILPNALIGISNFLPQEKTDKAIRQSVSAALSGMHDINGIVKFKDIGFSKLLVQLFENPELEAFFHELYDPILGYDHKHHSELIDTMMIFVEKDFDYMKTSKQLHVHVNTVRYRMHKIRELMPCGKSSLDFYQSLYFLYKMIRMKSLL